MTAPPHADRRARAARLAQSLAAPAQTLLGYQELLVEEARESGPADALPDLEKALDAARQLEALVDGIPGEGVDRTGGEARLRHDLRNPINALLGYSEMVAEEFAGELPKRLADDIADILRQGWELLDRIDAIGDPAREAAPAASESDVSIAADLARAMAAKPPPPPGERGRILVIDDMESNRDLLFRRLTRDAHQVVAAASAQEALDILETEDFDLALVDILMPDMNGMELLMRLKAHERWREIPVVMVSGLKKDDAVIRCIAAGAEDYLPKPVDPVLLRARITACLQRRRWRARERRYLARIEFEKERADTLLDAILPRQVVRRLAGGEELIADRFENVTILFADIVGFTPLAARTAPTALINRLGALFSRFDELAERCGVEKIKTIGDAYMAAAGLPEPRSDHADAALAFARALLDAARRAEGPEPPFRLRVGLHSGPVVAGLIGRKRFVYDIWGHTVNMASRLEASGAPGRIQLSQGALDALAAPAAVEPRGELRLKGVGTVRTYLLAE